MSWGGRRKGAGRKLGSKNPNAGRRPGSLNRLTRAVGSEMERTGEWPHEIFLRICRGETIDGFELTIHDRLKAAKAAAPYYHPKMKPVVVNQNEQKDYWDEILKLCRDSTGK